MHPYIELLWRCRSESTRRHSTREEVALAEGKRQAVQIHFEDSPRAMRDRKDPSFPTCDTELPQLRREDCLVMIGKRCGLNTVLDQLGWVS